MISHSSLRPSASLFSKHGVCLFCQKSLLVRGYAVRAPSTVRRDDAREPYYKNRTAEEIVARQLGKTYIGGHQKSMPRLPTEILVQAYRTRRIRIPPRTAEQIIREFEPVMKKPSAATTLVSICSNLRVKLDDLTGLGALLLQSKNPVERLLGRNMLMCASRAASPSATIFLVNAARKQNSLTAPELVKPQAHLKQLIQSNSTNVQALVLQGMLYQNQGKNSLAASLFKQAIAQPHKNTDPDENLPKRLARFIGFELENSDPNLDPRRPEDLELDVVQAHMQLSILQFTEHDDEAALENLKVAALKYDEPVAYFLLAERADQYSLEWLEYTRKAAASGYSSSMEDMGVIHSWSEEDLKQNVKDERVRDWILNNPLFGTEGWITSLTAALSKSQQKNLRTVKRYEWAVDWHVAADQRAHDRHKWAPYRVARLQWAMADLKQHIGQAPIWQLRYERVVCLKNMHYLEITKGVDPALKSEVEVVLRDILKDAMGREARALNIHWHNQGRTFQNDGNWLKDFLKSIDNVPIGKWR